MTELLEIISDVLGVAVDEHSRMAEVEEWDSFNHVMIMMELKDAFGLDVRPDDFENLVSVKQIYDYVNR